MYRKELRLPVEKLLNDPSLVRPGLHELNEIFGSNPEFRRESNLPFVELLRTTLGNCKWTSSNERYGDYTISYAKKWASPSLDIIKELKLDQEQNLFENSSNSLTPVQIIDLIIKNWDRVWNNPDTYRLLNICILLSEEQDTLELIIQFLNKNWAEKTEG